MTYAIKKYESTDSESVVYYVGHVDDIKKVVHKTEKATKEGKAHIYMNHVYDEYDLGRLTFADLGKDRTCGLLVHEEWEGCVDMELCPAAEILAMLLCGEIKEVKNDFKLGY